MPKWLAIIFIALSAPITMAQSLVMEKEYDVGKPIVVSIGELPSVPEATLTTVWQIEGAEYRTFDNTVALWGIPNADGSPRQVNVLCITRLTKKVKIEGTEYELEIPGSFKVLKDVTRIKGTSTPVPPGPQPNPQPPTPVPNPSIPEDAFGNLGRIVASWIAVVPEVHRSKRTELGAIYQRASTMVLTSKVEDVNRFLQTERVKVLNTPQLQQAWQEVGAKIGNDISSRQFNTRFDLSDYYIALYNGFKG